jgi:hypothetical protein
MDLQDQLKSFSDHEPAPEEARKKHLMIIRSKEPMICKFEKKRKSHNCNRRGSDADFKILAKIKTKLSAGLLKMIPLSFKEITEIKLWKY